MSLVPFISDDVPPSPPGPCPFCGEENEAITPPPPEVKPPPTETGLPGDLVVALAMAVEEPRDWGHLGTSRLKQWFQVGGGDIPEGSQEWIDQQERHFAWATELLGRLALEDPVNPLSESLPGWVAAPWSQKLRLKWSSDLLFSILEAEEYLLCLSETKRLEG